MIMRWLFRLAFPALGLLLVLIFFGPVPDRTKVTAEPDLSDFFIAQRRGRHGNAVSLLQ